MCRQRISDPHHLLLGYVEEVPDEGRVLLFDASRKRIGWYSIESDLTVSCDGRVVALGNKLLQLVPSDAQALFLEPEPIE